ncbi:MAG: glycosyltransferase [Bacteroidia bacterium]|nr:glycosyltransferase [Bacteroidia bacterium]
MDLSSFTIIVSAVFSLVYAIFVFKLCHAWKNIKEFGSTKVTSWPFISVIVCMRNESAVIPHLLTSLAAQNYPAMEFEIIVSDDFSEDDSVRNAENFAAENPHLNIKILKPSAPQKPGKKFALAAAVHHARGEIIAMTDADCTLNKFWLKTMVSHHFTSRAELTAGPVRLTGNSLFQKMQQIEFMSLAGTTGSFIQLRKPMMVNAANMMFNKQSFIDSGRMNPQESAASGDDTFFMLALAERNPDAVSFCKHETAMVETQAIQSPASFIQQRIRWASKTRHYPSFYIRLTGIALFAFHFLILLFFFLSFANSDYLIPAFMMLLSKWLADGMVLSLYNRFFKVNAGLMAWIVTFLIHPLYLVLIPLLTLKKNYKWKERPGKT